MAEPFILNPSQYDEEKNVIIKPPLFYSVHVKHLGFFYMLDDIKYAKILLQFPKVQITNKQKSKYDSTLREMTCSFKSIPDVCDDKKLKEYYQFIKTIDHYVETHVEKHKQAWRLAPELKMKHSIYRSGHQREQFMDIILPHDSLHGYLFGIYDERGAICDLDTITNKSIVSMVIELSDIHFTNSTYYVRWTMMQVRKHKPFATQRNYFMNQCILNDPYDKSEMHVLPRRIPTPPLRGPHIPPPPPPPISPKPLTPAQLVQPVGGTAFCPNENDLLNMKNKLRKCHS